MGASSTCQSTCSTGQNSGGRKDPDGLHLLLDHDGYLPSFAVVTEGKTSEIKVARTLRFAPGTILTIDHGYIDYSRFGTDAGECTS